MKTGMISLAMLVASTTAFAQKTLITEIEGGDLWLGASYASTSLDLELKTSGASTSNSVDTDEVSVSLIKAFNIKGDIAPILAINMGNSKTDGESTNIYSARAGVKLPLGNSSNLVVFGGYMGSGDDDEERSAVEAGLSFGARTNDFYNELSLSTTLPKDTSTIEGGNSVTVANAIKITPTHNLVLTGLFGVSLVSDIEINNDYTISSDPQFTFGGEAELFFTQNISAALLISKGFGNADAKGLGLDVDVEIDTTVVVISLNARF
ncbi:MAG: hypothetical protein ACJAR6_001173 [Oleispira sp.]|jgi:hypothetical protein